MVRLDVMSCHVMRYGREENKRIKRGRRESGTYTCLCGADM
jgi:hypothetical protein